MSLIIEVEEIHGRCPIYKKGDQISLSGAEISGKVCIHALSALTSLLIPLREGISPKCFSIGNNKEGYLQCPDPGPPLTEGGTVIFRIRCVSKLPSVNR